MIKETILEGIVIKSTGSWYTIIQEDGTQLLSRIKGNFKIKGISTTNPIAVGDKVDFFVSGDEGIGLITKIHERKNYIIRKSVKLSKQSQILAANIDMAYIIASLVAPRTSMGFIDRFLLTAEAYHVPVTIIFNKSDLYDEETMKMVNELTEIYEPLGYKCKMISSYNKVEVSELKQNLANKTNLFAGHSGVGKSTLVNSIEPNLNLKTGEISLQHLKGTHTTTFAEMHPLSFGGFIIDTPGIRDFTVIDFEKQEISHYFPEMRAMINDCQFNNCLHVHEPNCAVKQAVEDGKIHAWRYYNYLSILNNEDNYK